MGTFSYDSSVVLEIDDEVLAHIQLVIGAKLRRSESFYFTWQDESAPIAGRTVLWIHPSVPLAYQFTAVTDYEIDSVWLEELARSANTSQGITITAQTRHDRPI